MPAHILQLPDEVLLDIAEELSQPDWVALNSSSKRLRRISEPLLYRSIHMLWDETSYNPPIALLLRSILENPALSLHIRALKLAGRYYEGQYVDRPSSLTITTTLPEDKLLVATNSIGASSDMPYEIRAGNPDAFIALFVAKLENLEYLYLDVNWTLDTRFLGNLLKASFGISSEGPSVLRSGSGSQHSSFEALRRVYLITNEYEGSKAELWPRDTRDGLSLFFLPCIEHLTISVANPVKFSWPFNCKPSPSHLTSLELYRVRECYLGSVLSVLGSLQRLRYIWNYQPDIDSHVSKKIVELDIMAAAIVQRRNTLTDLEILARPKPAIAWGDVIDPELRMQGSLKILSQLHKLKRLIVPWTFLAGLHEPPPTGVIGSVLPPNVEQVGIHMGPGSLDDDYFLYEWGNEDYLSYFKTELNSGAMAHCRSLRKVQLPGYATRTGLSTEKRLELKSLGNQFGISIQQGGSYADVKPHKVGDSL